MTQAQVAREIGISQGLYNQLESGKRRMNETYLDALASLYGCSPLDLIVDPSRDDPLYQELDAAFRQLSPSERKILVSSAKGIVAGRVAN
jgi:transcriptional regulator with XRE-family HTH domain